MTQEERGRNNLEKTKQVEVFLMLLNLTFAGSVNGVLGPRLVGHAADHNVPDEDGTSVLLKPFSFLRAPVAGEECGFKAFQMSFAFAALINICIPTLFDFHILLCSSAAPN